ncbi:uncharacterized protein [Clytia hemisphaerica]|uniref:Uncharacterized protein n=1 Tax=Clytia hemisphaerica TaxID=252671 RepID=A0A7M5XFS5_9CNID|eukprot:TCONS_00008764-protein
MVGSMKCLFLIICCLVLLEACVDSPGKDCWEGMRKRSPPRHSRCCRLSRRYKTLFKRRDRQKRQCQRVVVALNSKVDGLKEALNDQQIVVRVIPADTQQPTVGQLVEIRDRTVALLNNAQFRNRTTSIPPLTTTTTTSQTTRRTKYPTTTTTTLKTTRPTKYPTTTTTTQKNTRYPTTTTRTTPTLPSPSDLWYSVPKYKLMDDTDSYIDSSDEFIKELFEGEEQTSDEEENEEEDFNEDDERKRRRRMTQTSRRTCPTPRQSLYTIPNLPPGTTSTFLSTRESLDAIGSILVRSCAECHYQINLPDGYYPREHRHVICPPAKVNCFAGIGKCAKNEVLMTIFKDTDNDSTRFDWDSKVNIIFNKGCGCQMLADYSFIGDGN